MIQYLHTTPAPPMGGTDALYNEILALRQTFGGSIASLYPFARPSSRYPAFLFGLHRLAALRRGAAQASLNHLFASALLHLPIVYGLQNPCIYSVAGSLPAGFRLPPGRFLRRVSSFVVSNERDFRALRERGVDNVALIRTGIDLAPFRQASRLLDGDLVLLMASAPWEKPQFVSKGIHLILQAIRQMNGVRVIFVWRDILPGHMYRLVREYGVADKVEVVNEKLHMPSFYEKIHGTILLANSPQLVKAYPHSLVESLVSGKPVVVSSQVPLSDFVQSAGCGLVLESFEAAALQAVFSKFAAEYPVLAANTLQLDRSVFSLDKMLAEYRQLYENYRVGR